MEKKIVFQLSNFSAFDNIFTWLSVSIKRSMALLISHE